jgi:RNA polymerase sigma factor (sigma-70 family)
MDEALLVSRAIAGDLDSFGQLYDSYFSRVYDFVWRILRDAGEAADATQDVFTKATQALPGLTKATSFKSWLFTIAHGVALTRAERGNRVASLPSPVHEEAFGSFDVPDPCRLDNPELVAGDHEAAALVWEAASALNARDYALLDLHVRRGLESAEIAAVMGVSKGNAETIVGRMKTAAADVIGSYIVARRGSKDCEALQGVLAAFEFPPYTEPVRKAVDAHIKTCETCQASTKRLAAPLEVLAAFAAVPAPMALKGDIWGEVSGAWAARDSGTAGGGHSGDGAGAASLPPSPYGPPVGAGAGGGFGGGISPMPADGGGGGDRTRTMLFAGGAIGLLVVAFAGGALLVSAFRGGGGVSSGTATATRTAAPTRTPSPAGTVTVGVFVETPTPNLTPSATPKPTETPTEEPPTETPTSAATATKTPRTTPTATPSPRASPTRTPPGGPKPTATPTPCPPGDPPCATPTP